MLDKSLCKPMLFLLDHLDQLVTQDKTLDQHPYQQWVSKIKILMFTALNLKAIHRTHMEVDRVPCSHWARSQRYITGTVMEIPGWTHLLEDHPEHPVAMDQAISWTGVELWKESSKRRSCRWLRKTEGTRVFGHFDGLDDKYEKYHTC